MGFFMKSQAEIDREKHIKRAFDLSSRAMRTDSEGERDACESLLKKHMKQHGITNEEVVDYAKQNQVGGKRPRAQQGGSTRPNYEQGSHYNNTRESKRQAEKNAFQKEYEEFLRWKAKSQNVQQEKADWKREARKQANEQWNEQFFHKRGNGNSRWRPNSAGVSAKPTTGEKIIKIIDSFFGL